MLVVIPPGVWHGVRNLENGDSTYVSLFDCAYDYADPDEWRLPPDTPAIPYRI
jgi:dTDP-4-dehydrorhamnose 3,5-epimerase